MLKILFIIPSMAFAGGAEKLINSLSVLLKMDYEIYIASFDPPNTKAYFHNLIPFYPLGNGPKLPLILRLFTYLIACNRISVLKRKLAIDIAISVLWRADLINALSQQNEKIISLSVINILNNETNSKMVKFRSIVGIVLRRFDKISAISPQIANELISLYKLNPVKIGTFKTFLEGPKTAQILQGYQHRFVFCARAVYEKNFDGLLNVFAQFTISNPGRKLVVIGDGPLLVNMKALAVQLGLSIDTQVDSDAQVLFVGSSNKPEVFMVGACAFLLTSRHEGVPTVVILAAALGLPIIAADCQGGGMRVLFNLANDAPLSDPESEDVPSAGLLLPIPDISSPQTIDIWVRAMEVVDKNFTKRDKWVRGALELAADHSPQSARQEWVSTIETLAKS
jgi:glycosyltransferase involved in cell wall biosynthesis